MDGLSSSSASVVLKLLCSIKKNCEKTSVKLDIVKQLLTNLKNGWRKEEFVDSADVAHSIVANALVDLKTRIICLQQEEILPSLVWWLKYEKASCSLLSRVLRCLTNLAGFEIDEQLRNRTSSSSSRDGRADVVQLRKSQSAEGLKAVLACRDLPDITVKLFVEHCAHRRCMFGLCKLLTLFVREAPWCRQQIMTEKKVFESLVTALSCKSVELTQAALSTVETCASVNTRFAKLLGSAGAVPVIVQLAEHSHSKIRRRAVLSLVYCVWESSCRFIVGACGGIKVLLSEMQSASRDSRRRTTLLKAIALCCQDVVCREKARDCGAVKVLLDMLADPSYKSLHNTILQALMNFYFDEASLLFMATKLPLISILAQRILDYHHRLRGCTTPVCGVSDCFSNHSDVLVAADIGCTHSESESVAGDDDSSVPVASAGQAQSLPKSPASTGSSTSSSDGTAMSSGTDLRADSPQSVASVRPLLEQLHHVPDVGAAAAASAGTGNVPGDARHESAAVSDKDGTRNTAAGATARESSAGQADNGDVGSEAEAVDAAESVDAEKMLAGDNVEQLVPGVDADASIAVNSDMVPVELHNTGDHMDSTRFPALSQCSNPAISDASQFSPAEPNDAVLQSVPAAVHDFNTSFPLGAPSPPDMSSANVWNTPYQALACVDCPSPFPAFSSLASPSMSPLSSCGYSPRGGQASPLPDASPLHYSQVMSSPESPVLEAAAEAIAMMGEPAIADIAEVAMVEDTTMAVPEEDLEKEAGTSEHNALVDECGAEVESDAPSVPPSTATSSPLALTLPSAARCSLLHGPAVPGAAAFPSYPVVTQPTAVSSSTAPAVSSPVAIAAPPTPVTPSTMAPRPTAAAPPTPVPTPSTATAAIASTVAPRPAAAVTTTPVGTATAAQRSASRDSLSESELAMQAADEYLSSMEGFMSPRRTQMGRVFGAGLSKAAGASFTSTPGSCGTPLPPPEMPESGPLTSPVPVMLIPPSFSPPPPLSPLRMLDEPLHVGVPFLAMSPTNRDLSRQQERSDQQTLRTLRRLETEATPGRVQRPQPHKDQPSGVQLEVFLLDRLSQVSECTPHLCSHLVVQALVARLVSGSGRFGSRCIRILMRMIDNARCFQRLLEEQSVCVLDRLRCDSLHCPLNNDRCMCANSSLDSTRQHARQGLCKVGRDVNQHLVQMAQTSFGYGTIMHNLCLKSQSREDFLDCCLLSLPLIIKKANLRHQLFIVNRCMQLLVEALHTTSDVVVVPADQDASSEDTTEPVSAEEKPSSSAIETLTDSSTLPSADIVSAADTGSVASATPLCAVPEESMDTTPQLKPVKDVLGVKSCSHHDILQSLANLFSCAASACDLSQPTATRPCCQPRHREAATPSSEAPAQLRQHGGNPTVSGRKRKHVDLDASDDEKSKRRFGDENSKRRFGDGGSLVSESSSQLDDAKLVVADQQHACTSTTKSSDEAVVASANDTVSEQQLCQETVDSLPSSTCTAGDDGDYADNGDDGDYADNADGCDDSAFACGRPDQESSPPAASVPPDIQQCISSVFHSCCTSADGDVQLTSTSTTEPCCLYARALREQEADVVFVVCDTCQLPAHRSTLSKAGDAMSAMLCGQFAEAEQGARIVLAGVSPHAVASLLHAVYGCQLRCPTAALAKDKVQPTLHTTLPCADDPAQCPTGVKGRELCADGHTSPVSIACSSSAGTADDRENLEISPNPVTCIDEQQRYSAAAAAALTSPDVRDFCVAAGHYCRLRCSSGVSHEHDHDDTLCMVLQVIVTASQYLMCGLVATFSHWLAENHVCPHNVTCVLAFARDHHLDLLEQLCLTYMSGCSRRLWLEILLPLHWEKNILEMSALWLASPTLCSLNPAAAR
eukprot:scpid4902/ scgid2295/ Armadillo repeat-containing protein 5